MSLIILVLLIESLPGNDPIGDYEDGEEASHYDTCPE
jgi:hypothetical protein